MIHFFASENLAIKAIEELEKKEFDNPSIQYFAIRKKKGASQYYIERGIFKEEKESNFISSVRVTIPDEDRTYLDKILNIKFVNIEVETVFTKLFYFDDTYETKYDFLPTLKGGISIGNTKTNGGTLGGIFTLKEFPNKTFGISNWHVLGYNTKKGDPIIHPGISDDFHPANPTDYQCGKLAWKCLDLKREVAFVELDLSYFSSVSKKNSCDFNLSNQIGKVKHNSKLKKCGNSSNCKRSPLSGKCLKRVVYSHFAIIKVHQNVFGSNNPRKFKNQILIDNFSDKGDSGSLIVDKNNNVIGLIFAVNLPGSLTIANNINFIFNHDFTSGEVPDINVDNQNHKVSRFTINSIF